MSSEQTPPSSTRRNPPPRQRLLLLLLAAILLVPLIWVFYGWLAFPSDRTPEGAYLRVVKAVNQGEPSEFFAYTEEAAQHACFTIRNYRKQALERAQDSYPEREFAPLKKSLGRMAEARDGKDIFGLYAQDEGWIAQLRSDLSGIDHIEIAGERATVETTRGTRYAFRRRPNGIWGLTAFTPTLVAEAERAARDLALIEKAAADYDRRKTQHSGAQ